MWNEPEEREPEQKKALRLYVDKSIAYEDIKSTAVTFLMVGVLGLIALILFGFDVISLSMASYMKIIMLVVMGTLFVLFIVIGMLYLRKLKAAKANISKEADLTDEIMRWFSASYSAEAIDRQLEDTSVSEEQLYFVRYEVMMQRLLERYPDLEESYADHILELLYGKIFTD